MEIRRIVLLSIGIYCLINISMAYTDEDGNQFETFIVNYETGEKTYVDFETKDEFYDLIRSKLVAECNYEYDKDGVTVEWTIKNGLFTNYDAHCPNYYPTKRYYWYDRTGMLGMYVLDANGMVLNTGDTETFMVPATIDTFTINEGFRYWQAKMEILEVNSVNIGNYELFSSGEYYHTAGELNYWGNVTPREDVYTPASYYQVIRDYPDDDEPKFLSVALYFGKYRYQDWNLKAVTKLKYRISNVTYNPPKFVGIDAVDSNVNEELDSKTLQYYNLHGMEVISPKKGEVLIERDNKKHCKIIIK